MMGVGGDNSWEPDVVHPEFLLPASSAYHYSVVLSPLDTGAKPYKEALRNSNFWLMAEQW
jgi:hypothetical protein